MTEFFEHALIRGGVLFLLFGDLDEGLYFQDLNLNAPTTNGGVSAINATVVRCPGTRLDRTSGFGRSCIGRTCLSPGSSLNILTVRAARPWSDGEMA